jgi:subtilase family serine protease
VVASGDQGAGFTQAKSTSSSCTLTPVWPASSPYVVSVGATQGVDSGTTEVVCECSVSDAILITSGGGVSNYYSQPSYQTNFTSQYFAKLSANPPSFMPSSSQYSVSKRVYPDVTAAGHAYSGLILFSFYYTF